MAVLSLMELIDIVAMSLIVGYIFKDIFKAPVSGHYDPLKSYAKKFFTEDLKFAIMVTAPAIVLHELAHKIVALSVGLAATFHAAYTWLGVGVLLKLLGTGIIFFVPAFVSISGSASPLAFSAVAFAGPAMNLILFLAAWLFEKYGKIPSKYISLVALTKRINLFLFIFNMIPIPPFDGFKVFQGLLQTFM